MNSRLQQLREDWFVPVDCFFACLVSNLLAIWHPQSSASNSLEFGPYLMLASAVPDLGLLVKKQLRRNVEAQAQLLDV